MISKGKHRLPINPLNVQLPITTEAIIMLTLALIAAIAIIVIKLQSRKQIHNQPLHP
jgi:hypothetical protein